MGNPLDDDPFARVTGAPVLHDARLYVPVSSIEEAPPAGRRMSVASFEAASWR